MSLSLKETGEGLICVRGVFIGREWSGLALAAVKPRIEGEPIPAHPPIDLYATFSQAA
jgi:hypothetical protein